MRKTWQEKLSAHFAALGRKGGKARLEKMTPEARRQIAVAGGKARAKQLRRRMGSEE